MIKMTMLLKRHPGLTHTQFIDHHIHRHGPLFRSIPEAATHVLRYLQTHPIADRTGAVEVADFDGTAEIWFDDLAGLEAVLNSDAYREKVFPDEKTFLDHAGSLVTIGSPLGIIGGDTEASA